MSNQKKALITGLSGQDGSYLAEFLLGKGYKVYGTLRRHSVSVVNGTLYNYGLEFSYDWAQPYWLMFRVSLVLIVVAVVLISVVELPHPAFEDRE